MSRVASEAPVARLVRAACVPRAEIEAQTATSLARGETDPGWLAAMVPLGERWRVYLAERGFPCPARLIELADLSADYLVDIGGWQLGPPDAAEADRATLRRLAERSPELAPHVDTVALLGCDGDLVLLARDGRVHLWLHDAPEGSRVVASSFDALIDALLDSFEGRRPDFVLAR